MTSHKHTGLFRGLSFEWSLQDVFHANVTETNAHRGTCSGYAWQKPDIPCSVVAADFVTRITHCELLPAYLVMSSGIRFCHQTHFKQGFLWKSSPCNWIGKNTWQIGVEQLPQAVKAAARLGQRPDSSRSPGQRCLSIIMNYFGFSYRVYMSEAVRLLVALGAWINSVQR